MSTKPKRYALHTTNREGVFPFPQGYSEIYDRQSGDLVRVAVVPLERRDLAMLYMEAPDLLAECLRVLHGDSNADERVLAERIQELLVRAV